MQHRISLIVAFVVLAVVSCLLGTVLMPNSSVGGEKEQPLQPVNFRQEKQENADSEKAAIDTDFDTGDSSLFPIEEDMHEFMEYVFQPSFKRLKPAMENEPADNAGWKAIKAEALTLAEGGNLILMRVPDVDKDIWNLHGVKVRGHGRNLYRAAQAKDFKLASREYRMMLISCNACHYKFAGGEHILTP